MVKETLSEHPIDEIQVKIDSEDAKILKNTVCTSKADIRKLEATAKQLQKQLDTELWNNLKVEIQKIKEDNRWVDTKRDKYILAINEWMQLFHKEFRVIAEFEYAFIGGHAEKEAVFICGKVADKKDYNALLGFIQSKNPPFKVITDVIIGDSN